MAHRIPERKFSFNFLVLKNSSQDINEGKEYSFQKEQWNPQS